ncbi:MAG: site-specific integrase [Rickettsia endosymbiont of Labidopullus appendiculatus]|nr:site-specific integrase [Rickettsia endosymbiont of Labidopullus appendiculatus]
MTNPLFHFTNKAIEKNPTRNIEVHKKEIRRRFISTKEAMSKFFEVINAEPNRKMADFFLMALFTRARKAEVLSMRWQDINFENRTWYLHQARKIYLMKDALAILARRYKENNTESIWVFPNSTSSNHLQVRKSWQKICQLAGINGLMIHDLRMTHDVWMSKVAEDREIIWETLGYQDISTTKICDIMSDQVMKSMETQRRENEARQRKIEELEQQIRELKYMQNARAM